VKERWMNYAKLSHLDGWWKDDKAPQNQAITKAKSSYRRALGEI